MIPQASWCGPSYPNNTKAWDTWGTVLECSTPTQRGCLFDIFADPTEQHDLAPQMPKLVDELYARLEELDKTLFDPDRGKPDVDRACAAVVRRGGYWGPWLEDGEALY